MPIRVYVSVCVCVCVYRKFEEANALSPRCYSPTDAYIQSWLQATLNPEH